MDRVDEQAARRPDFQPGTPIVLADGQTWHFRKPLVWFIPHDENESGFRTVLSLDGDDGFQDQLDRLNALFKDPEVKAHQIVGPELAIARRLLLVNYDLNPTQVAQVLRWSYVREENPDGVRIREEIMEVAEGVGPKRPPDGTESAPTPSGEFPGATA